MPPAWGRTPQEAYLPPAFSPSLRSDGVLIAQVPRREALAPVADFPLVDTRSGGRVRVADVLDEVDA